VGDGGGWGVVFDFCGGDAVGTELMGAIGQRFCGVFQLSILS
jgi:hypothetical protein